MTQLTFGPVNSRSVDHDVIAVFHIHVVVTRPGDHDVVALGRGLARFGSRTVITLEEVLTTTGIFDPIVTGAAAAVSEEDAVENVVITLAAKHFAELADIDQEVVAIVAENEVLFVTTVDVVVAFTAKERVRARQIGNDVVSGTALNEVATVVAFDAIVATAAPERIITDAADDRVVAFSAADGDVIATRVHHDPAGIGNKEIHGQSVCIANDQGNQNRIAFGINTSTRSKNRRSCCFYSSIGIDHVLRRAVGYCLLGSRNRHAGPHHFGRSVASRGVKGIKDNLSLKQVCLSSRDRVE